MNSELLPDRLSKFFCICYWATFWILLCFVFVFFSAVIFILSGVTEEDSFFIHYLFLVPSVAFVSCVAMMVVYSVTFVGNLWRKGKRRQAAICALGFCVLSLLVGYFWFYSVEIRKGDTIFAEHAWLGGK